MLSEWLQKVEGAEREIVLSRSRRTIPPDFLLRLYDRKTRITAAEILNDRVVPFYDELASGCRGC